MGALLAQHGFLATSEFLTASDGGLYATYSNGGCPDAAIADLGQRWNWKTSHYACGRPPPPSRDSSRAMFDLVEKNQSAP